MKPLAISSFQKLTFLLVSFFYTLFSPSVIGQVPQGIPKDNGPIDLSSTSNIIVYVVLPLVVVAIFVIWRIANRRKRREEEGL
jgi:uncharacterized BrkB/YihY/UPF0761 family membrane protein